MVEDEAIREYAGYCEKRSTWATHASLHHLAERSPTGYAPRFGAAPFRSGKTYKAKRSPAIEAYAPLHSSQLDAELDDYKK